MYASWAAMPERSPDSACHHDGICVGRPWVGFAGTPVLVDAVSGRRYQGGGADLLATRPPQDVGCKKRHPRFRDSRYAWSHPEAGPRANGARRPVVGQRLGMSIRLSVKGRCSWTQLADWHLFSEDIKRRSAYGEKFYDITRKRSQSYQPVGSNGPADSQLGSTSDNSIAQLSEKATNKEICRTPLMPKHLSPYARSASRSDFSYRIKPETSKKSNVFIVHIS